MHFCLTQVALCLYWRVKRKTAPLFPEKSLNRLQNQYKQSSLPFAPDGMQLFLLCCLSRAVVSLRAGTPLLSVKWLLKLQLPIHAGYTSSQNLAALLVFKARYYGDLFSSCGLPGAWPSPHCSSLPLTGSSLLLFLPFLTSLMWLLLYKYLWSLFCQSLDHSLVCYWDVSDI